MKRPKPVPRWRTIACDNCGGKAGACCTRTLFGQVVSWPIACAARKRAAAPPSRVWYIAPYPCRPGLLVDTAVLGPYDMAYPVADLRGGVLTAAEAVKVAAAWRLEGRRSGLWLLLVEDHRIRHCNRYIDPERP